MTARAGRFLIVLSLAGAAIVAALAGCSEDKKDPVAPVPCDESVHLWTVPCEVATIQAAIDSAAAGDTVRVAAGTYLENLHMKSGVVVVSADGAAQTTIDGGGTSAVVTFDTVSNAVLEGFTITHGNGPAPGGGGVRAVNSSGVLRSNVVSGNRSEAFGGGICLSRSNFTLELNHVDHDSATSHGGGIALVDSSQAVITRNRIEFNTNLRFDTGGGGVYLDTLSFAEITYNAIVRNIGGESHGGGGILCAAPAATIRYNTIVNNGFRTPLPLRTGRASSLHGPGAGVLFVRSGAELSNNIIGQVSGVPHDYGSAVHGDASDPVIRYNDVWNNPVYTTFPRYSGSLSDIDITGVNGNIAVDPVLCLPDSLDFALTADSPCVAASETGGPLGALEPGCGP